MNPISPQDDPALIAKLSAMTDDEFTAVVTKARGANLTDIKSLIIGHLTNPQGQPS